MHSSNSQLCVYLFKHNTFRWNQVDWSEFHSFNYRWCDLFNFLKYFSLKNSGKEWILLSISGDVISFFKRVEYFPLKSSGLEWMHSSNYRPRVFVFNVNEYLPVIHSIICFLLKYVPPFTLLFIINDMCTLSLNKCRLKLYW